MARGLNHLRVGDVWFGSGSELVRFVYSEFRDRPLQPLRRLSAGAEGPTSVARSCRRYRTHMTQRIDSPSEAPIACGVIPSPYSRAAVAPLPSAVIPPGKAPSGSLQNAPCPCP